MVGAIHAVTEEDGRVRILRSRLLSGYVLTSVYIFQLLVKSYPVIRDMPPIPQWQFIPVKN